MVGVLICLGFFVDWSFGGGFGWFFFLGGVGGLLVFFHTAENPAIPGSQIPAAVKNSSAPSLTWG